MRWGCAVLVLALCLVVASSAHYSARNKKQKLLVHGLSNLKPAPSKYDEKMEQVQKKRDLLKSLREVKVPLAPDFPLLNFVHEGARLDRSKVALEQDGLGPGLIISVGDRVAYYEGDRLMNIGDWDVEYRRDKDTYVIDTIGGMQVTYHSTGLIRSVGPHFALYLGPRLFKIGSQKVTYARH
eukprot:TRINITY_DN445_c0_g1_i2.p1 TRINITY_DN445_c0_g1~~TRINITY_DN445_c0_g1_i2.p1  ORF type:complete len:182 (-),score=21.77 TRINITY_DN445_c0_g1_i2:188-733(-)